MRLVCAAFLCLALAVAAPPASANAIEEHTVTVDENGVRLDWRTADNQQRGYVAVDSEGWAGAGTHDGAANGAGAHVGTETLVGYGLGWWWCDAGVKLSEPDLIYSRGTECWSYDCLDDGRYNDVVAYALADPETYLAYVMASSHLC